MALRGKTVHTYILHKFHTRCIVSKYCQKFVWIRSEEEKKEREQLALQELENFIRSKTYKLSYYIMNIYIAYG